MGYSPWGRKVRYNLPTKQHVNSISTKLEEKTKSTIQNKRKSELTLKEAFWEIQAAASQCGPYRQKILSRGAGNHRERPGRGRRAKLKAQPPLPHRGCLGPSVLDAGSLRRESREGFAAGVKSGNHLGLQYFPATGEKTEAHRGPQEPRVSIPPPVTVGPPRGPQPQATSCFSGLFSNPSLETSGLSAGITGLTLALKILQCEQAQETLGQGGVSPLETQAACRGVLEERKVLMGRAHPSSHCPSQCLPQPGRHER